METFESLIGNLVEVPKTKVPTGRKSSHRRKSKPKLKGILMRDETIKKNRFYLLGQTTIRYTSGCTRTAGLLCWGHAL